MSIRAASGAPVQQRADDSLVTLARIETLRLARHPIFVVAVALFVLVTVTTPFSEYANADYDTSLDGTESNLDWPVLPAFTLGLGGLLAVHRITTSAERAGDLLRAAPVTLPRRTAALCLACLLPAAIALLGASYVFVFWMVDPPVQSIGWGEYSNAELVAMMAGGVLAALGGPLLGVTVARWWRWPTAAAVTCVLLILWSGLSLIADTNRMLTLNHMASPFTLAESVTETSAWHQGGSWLWRLVYLASLCATAALTACAAGTEGEQRRRMVRWTLVALGVAVTALLLSAFTGPEGYFGRWEEGW